MGEYNEKGHGPVQGDDMRRALAQSKSYVGSAVITYVAYCLGWLPGLIFNIMFLREARANERLAGHSLPGSGCLQWLLILNAVWVLGLCLLLSSIGVLGTAS